MKKNIKTALGIIAGTAAAWMIAVKPRLWNKPDLSEIRRYDYAKKGYFNPSKDIPENSMAAFRAAIEHGYGIALDVRLTRDGVPVVFGDAMLIGMTGARGNVENSTWAELKELKLDGTEEGIPTLDQALQLIDGQVPVLVNMISAEGNQAGLADQVCEVLDAYEGVFAVESLDPRILLWYRKQRPEYIRGQVVDVIELGLGFKAWLWRILCSGLLLNFLAEPDYVSHNVDTRFNPSVFICRRIYRIPGMVWNVADETEYEKVKTDGASVVFEGIEP